MNILIDTSILISYLIYANRPPIQTIMQLVFEKKVRLLLPDELLLEVAEVAQRSSLQKYIASQDVHTLVKTLKVVGTTLPRINRPFPKVTTDPKDDYLIAYAVLHQADYLITGDKKHLLPLEQIGTVRTVTPAQFLHLFGTKD